MSQLVRLFPAVDRFGRSKGGVQDIIYTAGSLARNFWFALQAIRIRVALVPGLQTAQLENMYLNEEIGIFLDWIGTQDPDWLRAPADHHRITAAFVEDWPPQQVFTMNTLKSLALPQTPDRRVTLRCGDIKRRIRV